MGGSIESRLDEMGITIPEAPRPVASYVGYVISGSLVFVSGQLPFVAGELSIKGKLGEGVSLEEGTAAARQCAINILAQVKAACGGDLERIVRCVRLGGFVASAPHFTDQPKVINGASELIGAVLAERGVHSRAAVGVAVLPLDASVEIEAVFEIAG